MLAQLPPLLGFPAWASSGLDMTADFAPLFIGLWVLLGISGLGLAVAATSHNAWWIRRKSREITEKQAPLPDAA